MTMTKLIDLVALFETLPLPTSTPDARLRFSAVPITGQEQHRLAKDAQGAPSLLISVAENSKQVRPIPIVLEHLTVQHDVDCRVARPDGVNEEGSFTVLRCTNTDLTMRLHFLRVASSLVASLGPTPSRLDITRAIDQLVELFRAMSNEPKKSVQGLWAELFIMARTRNPIPLIKAWHLSTDECYDFSMDNQRLEVKSTTNNLRQHYFSLEQVRRRPGVEVLVASMFVERLRYGVSVVELVNQLRNRVSSQIDLLLHLDRVVALTLGENWHHALEFRFDKELAEQSLVFYELDAIPSVNPDVPSGVSEVRFKSDLTGKPSADLTRYQSSGALFRALLR